MEATSHGALFEATVWQLAGEHQISLTRVVASAKASGASASAREGGVITYGPIMEHRSPEYVCWAAAHELAHVALGHAWDWRAHRDTLGRAGAALAVGAALLICGILASMTVLRVTGFLVVVGAVVFALGTITYRQRECERAADALAARWGHPVTGPLVEEMARAEGLVGWMPLWFRDHPRPADRVTGTAR